MLPEGWNIESLEDVVTIGSGQVDPKEEPYSSMLHIGAEDIESETGRLLQPKTAAELGLISGKYEFDERAVVYSKIRPNLNKVCFPRFKGICSADAYPIWAKNALLLPAYLKYFLLSPPFVKYAVACSMRTGMPKINREDLLAATIRVPPKTEQARIALILDTWEAAISSTEKLLANSRRRKRDLMQGLLSGHRGFGPAKLFWAQPDFDEVFERITRKNNVGEQNVLTISGQHGLISQREFFNKNVASENLQGYTLLEKGDFAYNKSYSAGYPVGAIKPLLAYKSGVVSSLYICFRIRSDVEAEADFFRHYFEAGMLNDAITGIAQEGARNHGLLNVSVKDFFKLKLRVPEIESQRKIAAVLNTAESEERCIGQQLAKLKKEKRALMADLLTGNRRVHLPEATAEPKAA